MENNPHSLNAEQIFKAYQTSKKGLTDAEAKARLQTNGANELVSAKKKSKWAMFLGQFKDFMLIILLISAMVTGIIAVVTKNYADLIDVGVILAIVLLNAVIGFVQENKAENALASLKKMSQPFVKVYRDGKLVQISTRDVVVGDLVYFEAGDVVCADCYLIESHSLKSDESSLTGESNEIEKVADTPLLVGTVLGDRVNMLHSGCVVTYGRGVGVVTATGMNTEIGKIANMLNNQQEEMTPIQQKLNKLGKWITVGILLIAFVVFVINVILKAQHDVLDSLLVAIALAVAAIPESLPAVITVIMATGVSRMSKQRAIVRKMQAVETLGSCQIICTDKTGTLTQNKMTLTSIYTNGNIYGKNDLNSVKNTKLFECMLLCNDTVVQGKKLMGDSTETALVSGASALGHDFINVNMRFKRVYELPFDSDRKMMTTFNKINDEIIGFTKGAPDVVLDRCEYVEINGEITRITKQVRADIESALERFALKGLRTLSFAYKIHKSNNFSLEDENKMIFLGISAMRDPPRDTTASAVATCISAGIRPIMITGDHAITAREIAREVGIFHDGDMILTGAELDNLSDEDYAKIIDKVTVYARVSPQNKVRIVQGWKATGAVVAMTGDGVNDAPSIKCADIGIGMGQTGTEVTKEVADIVLTDDNFATIVGAITEGRKIYSNIKKVIQFLFGTNFVEVLSILLITLISPTLGFLSAMQILFINLITDALPALSLSVERAEKDVMKQAPRKKSEPLFANIWGVMVTQVLWLTGIVVGAYYIVMAQTGSEILATTFGFTILSLSQIFHLINVRNTHSIFSSKPFHNWLYWVTLLICMVLNVAVVAIPPVAGVFGLVPLTIVQWGIVFGLAFTIVPVIEIYKLIRFLVLKINLKRKQKINIASVKLN